ncbi:hypothetical protein BHM03_00051827 [Ensete ventricosum]|nr:hypothetical protein BHM03_00051827 [Ensete ventricosum]
MATLRPHHLFLLLLHHVLTVCSTVAAFAPEDNFLINCGANATVTSADGRPFRPDTSGEVSSFVMSPISHDVVQVSSSDVNGSARVFREAAAYRIHIRSGFGRETVICPVMVAPSNGSIAFINAIEVVSVPGDLVPSVASPVPPGPGVEISARTGFETAYRINVGGPVLDSSNDTLWRVWEDDRPFLVISASVHSISTDPDSIRYPSEVPQYIAPSLVYATAQEMADANVGNQKFNISWVFKIELGFMYLVRLHFCDFFEQVHQKPSVQCLYFVDFIIDVQMDSDRRILVQIGPPELTNFPPDAILNGLEIFKLSDSDDNFDVNHIIWNAKKPTLASFPSPVAPTTHTGSPNTKLSARSYASSGPSLGIGQLLAFSEIQEVTKNFEESLVVGIGGFGKVYRGVLENGLVVAVKRGNPQSQQGLVEFRTEIEMLSKLRHRHLVSLIGHCHEANNYGACL